MKTYEILYQTLAATSGFVRGQDLANQLGLSRTAIWKAIQTLEQQGIAIEAIKNRGYRWLSGDLLLPEQLSQSLSLPVTYTPNSQSTQNDARHGIEQGLSAPHLYLAPNQTAAKGRFGRSFFASPQGGIYMSLHLKPNLSHSNLPAYTLMTAASVVKAIQQLTGIACSIKWVNDIYLKRKKIAGIITEAITSIETGLVTDVIIGVGINFHITDFPTDLTDKAGSLFAEAPTITRNQLIAAIWNTFFQTSEAELVRYYKDNSLVLGQSISFLDNGQSLTGQVLEIGDKGDLLVQLADGQTRQLNSGEVRLTAWSSWKRLTVQLFHPLRLFEAYDLLKRPLTIQNLSSQ